MGALIMLTVMALYRMVQRFRFVPSRTRRPSRQSSEIQSMVVKDYGSIAGRGRSGEKVEVEVEVPPS